MPTRGFFYISEKTGAVETARRYASRGSATLSAILALVLAIMMRLIYGYRVCPVLAVGDSGELATASWTNGVAHPPGYPLFVLLGRWFTHMNFHSPSSVFEEGIFDPAFRMNMMSLWLGVATVLVVYFILARALKNPFAAFLGAFIFGTGRTFLSQSLIGEVYTLHGLIIALMFYALLLIDEKPTGVRLCFLALLFGLGLSNHASILLMVIPTFIFVVMAIIVKGVRIRKNLLISMLVFFVIGLLPYLYLPIASSQDPYLDWGNPENPVSFYKVVTRAEFRQIKESIQTTEGSIGYRGLSKAFGRWQRQSFGRLLIILGYIGMLIALVKGKRFGVLLVLSYFLMTVPYFIYFRKITPPDLFYLEVYYIPAHLVFAIFIGYFIYAAIDYIPRVLRKKNIMSFFSFAIFVIFAVIIGIFWFGHGSRYTMRDHTVGSRYAHDVLRDLPNDSILVTSGDEPFLFWYMQQVANYRRDVVVLENNTLMMTRSWYWQSVKREYPDFAVPDVDLSGDGTDLEIFIAELHDLNPNRPIFFTSLLSAFDPQSTGYTLVPDGLLLAFGKEDEFKSLIMERTSLADGLFESPLDFSTRNLDPYEDELVERYAYAYFNYGGYYLTKGQDAKAKEILMRAVNLKPDFQPEGFLPVAGMLARSMIKEGDLKGARDVLSKLIETGKADSAWYYLYAQVLVLDGQFDAAIRVLQEGLERDPENQFLQSLLETLTQPWEDENPPPDEGTTPEEAPADNGTVDV